MNTMKSPFERWFSAVAEPAARAAEATDILDALRSACHLAYLAGYDHAAAVATGKEPPEYLPEQELPPLGNPSVGPISQPDLYNPWDETILPEQELPLKLYKDNDATEPCKHGDKVAVAIQGDQTLVQPDPDLRPTAILSSSDMPGFSESDTPEGETILPAEEVPSCPGCSGVGAIDEADGDPLPIGHKNSIPCPECHGSGLTQEDYAR